MKQIANGLRILHEHRIIHRDIKSRNCMVRNQNRCNQAVIIDFDLCKIKDTEYLINSNMKEPTGTEGYIAPELFCSHKYDELVDVYSCGIMFGEWFFGKQYHRDRQRSGESST